MSEAEDRARELVEEIWRRYNRGDEAEARELLASYGESEYRRGLEDGRSDKKESGNV